MRDRLVGASNGMQTQDDAGLPEQSPAIGGYLGFELPQPRPNRLDVAQRFNSTQAAFLALLAHLPWVERIWMPVYICETMPAAVRRADKVVVPYHVGHDLAPDSDIAVGPCDIILCVNYFGICDGQVQRVLQMYGRDRVVVDCAQALFDGPYDCLATLYSPRKFLGLPDGGLLVTNAPVSGNYPCDETSIHRMDHLIRRIAQTAEAGYRSFQRAEADLEGDGPKRMSRLTQRLLSSVDFDNVRFRRSRNFAALHDVLVGANGLHMAGPAPAALCYPFLARRGIDRLALARHRIYLPCYWPDVLEDSRASTFEIGLVNRLAAIPCDQQYEPDILIQLATRLLDGHLS